ncbi:DUF4328 domain-containing protein [Myroides odoratimimus]|uniref:DUF4328 domain-containing protein n=1 Tax=Myroides TaxID=76831 RepID=UPI00057E886F|nr:MULTISPECIES: DUF4328 domain-containing protein [Myroides]AJA70751.1 Protein of unknown function DUF4328 [Myroides sp. A21]MDM1097460.1 DUF4328 domain-containing protein [Myroides odoratimimus]MDM1402312.1 DUF4328 domain-containing protein [Myroides odoratimimus]MDM1537785.1 DUF4328 domain-containing protein [Myroides odoratimimus]MDM1677338.1 DUF4328 domain-containing protein [Myroides odoratimimus]
MLLSNVSRGDALMVAIKLLIISSVASLNCLLIQHNIYTKANLGVQYINKDLVRFETINFIVTILNIVAGAFFLIVFIVWFYRAYVNMQSLDTRLHDSKYWVVFGWLIPVFNLVMPYRLLNKMTISAVSYIHKNTTTRLQKFRSYWILLIWISFLLIYLLRIYQYSMATRIDVMYIIELGIIINALSLLTLFVFASYFNFYRKMEALIYKLEHENKEENANCIELVRE